MASRRPAAIPLWAKRLDDPDPPEGWQETSLVAVAEIRFSNVDKKSYVSEKPVRLCNYTDVYNKEYVHGHEDFMHATASETEISKFRVHAGDVIITKDSETPDDIGVPAVVLSAPKDLLCGYHLALIRPCSDEVDPMFLAKQIAHTRISRYYARLANGLTRYGLTNAVVEFTPVWLPEPSEQQGAAQLLRGIDEAILKTESLITKLKAIKRGFLHDLLTRGLDDNGELRDPERHPEQFRDSELRRIPKPWVVVSIKDVGRIVAGATPSRSVPAYWGGDVPWITPTDMTALPGDYISGGVDSLTRKGLGSCAAVLLPGGSIVVTTRASLGLAAITSCELATNQGFKSVIPDQGWDATFLCYRLRGLTREMVKRASGTTFLEVSGTQFGLIQFAAPRLESGEQERIGQLIRAQAHRIEVEIRHLSKLRAIKEGLSQDVFIGRVRVTAGNMAVSSTG